MKIKVLLSFVRKYGKPKSVTIYLNSDNKLKVYDFYGGRWVSTDITGELGWNGKQNIFNIAGESL